MTFINSTVHLPDGSLLAYLDSLPVPGSKTFTTVVILHGLCFNSFSFEDLLARAPRYNLRLVLVQRKDYRGSSLYTQEEMELLSNEPQVFLERIGKTTLQFLEFLVTHTSISPLNSTKTTGGIKLLGWSLGCTQAISAFSTSLMRSERKTYNLVEPYLRGLVLYDPPHTSLGIPLQPAEALYNPFSTNEPLEKQLQNFNIWVTSYFDHPKDWDGRVTELDGRKYTDKFSIRNWSKDQIRKRVEEFPLRSDGILLSDSTQPSVEKMAEDVVFNSNSSRAFPHAKINYISPRRSTWTCIWAEYIAKKKYQSMKRKHGVILRSVSFKEIGHANHALHSDFPEEFLGILQGFQEEIKPESRL